MGLKRKLFGPAVLLSSSTHRSRFRERYHGGGLEDQSSADNKAAIAAVRRPLVKKRPRVNRRCRDALRYSWRQTFPAPLECGGLKPLSISNQPSLFNQDDKYTHRKRRQSAALQSSATPPENNPR
jgi:hypothetical protein